MPEYATVCNIVHLYCEKIAQKIDLSINLIIFEAIPTNWSMSNHNSQKLHILDFDSYVMMVSKLSIYSLEGRKLK